MIPGFRRRQADSGAAAPVTTSPLAHGLLLLRQFWPMVAVFVAVSFLSIFLIVIGSTVQVVIRTVGAGEGAWSKAFHEAVFHLDRFAERGDPAELALVDERLEFIHCYRKLRVALQEGRIDDPERAAIALAASGFDPADLPAAIRYVQRFRNAQFMRNVLVQWSNADGPVDALVELRGAIVADWADGSPDSQAMAEARARIVEVRGAVRPVSDRFSEALGAAARTLRKFILGLALVSVSSLALLGFLLTGAVLRRISESEQRFRHLLNTANDGVVAVEPESGRILGCNYKMSELSGRREAMLVGRLYADLFPRDERDLVIAADGRVADGVQQLHLLHRDGHQTPVEVSANYTRWGDRDALIGIVRDVTERRAHERRIEYLASHDSLTGLVNRREFESRAAELLDERRGRGHALLYLDLDQFKVVNDTCGHAAGDELLRQLTVRLRRCVRDSDTLARLGGDEFGILLTECTIEQAEQVANKLIATVNDWHFSWGDRRFTIGTSIGVVPLDGSGGTSLAALMSAADSACYAAKEAGRNRIIIYQPGDAALLEWQGEMHWMARLTDALADGRFELYCQRIVSADSATASGHNYWELLLRLREADGTLVDPGTFLPAAERFNLAPAIDRKVIRLALDGMRASLDAGEPESDLYAVNLSGASLGDPGFADYIKGEFERTRVPPSMVCFEITETAAVASIDAARLFVARMHALGCRMALDDFGTGMSSFAYLRDLKVDYLKIDGGFVRDLDTNHISAAMVRAIYELSKAIGLRTVAEFVETEAVLEQLRKMGGDMAQGYAVHRPERWRWN